LVERSFGRKATEKTNIELGDRIKQIILANSSHSHLRFLANARAFAVFHAGNAFDSFPPLFSLLGFGELAVMLVSKQLRLPPAEKARSQGSGQPEAGDYILPQESEPGGYPDLSEP